MKKYFLLLFLLINFIISIDNVYAVETNSNNSRKDVYEFEKVFYVKKY